jgi:DNA-binding XRE family transcriptional regulator
MDRVQIIDTPKGEKLAVLPFAEYERLRELDEEDEDERDVREADAIMKRVKAGKEPLIPGDVVFKVYAEGVPRLRAWRDYRGLTVEKLAKKASIARAYLTQIENGSRKGTVATLRKIAKALGTTVDALLD